MKVCYLLSLGGITQIRAVKEYILPVVIIRMIYFIYTLSLFIMLFKVSGMRRRYSHREVNLINLRTRGMNMMGVGPYSQVP